MEDVTDQWRAMPQLAPLRRHKPYRNAALETPLFVASSALTLENSTTDIDVFW